MIISSPDKARFEEDGFLIVDELISPNKLPVLHQAFDHLFNGIFETGVHPDEVNWQQATGDPSLTRQICNGWKANREIARVVLDAALGRAVAELADWPGARIMIEMSSGNHRVPNRWVIIRTAVTFTGLHRQICSPAGLRSMTLVPSVAPWNWYAVRIVGLYLNRKVTFTHQITTGYP